MNKILFKLLAVSAVILATLTSCNDDPTVQSYYVDSQDKEGFINMTVPRSILGVDESTLSADSKEAFNSMKKVNLLVLPAGEDKKDMIKKESELFASILEDERYKTLMMHNADGMKIRFVYDGSSDSIDELIVFGSADEMGMGVARIMGDDMNLSSIMKMMKDFDKESIDPSMIQGALKNIGVDIKDQMKEIESDSSSNSSQKAQSF